MCWSAKWYGEKQIFFDSIHKSTTRKMISSIHKMMDEADAIVHYNGSKFDIPTLNKEFLLLSLPPPSPSKQIDLLSTARRQFRFPSNKLDYIAQQLDLGKKIDHVGHQLWIDCMNGDGQAWKVMERYNKHDVVLLERVYYRLLPWIKGHPNQAIYGDCTCPHCGGNKYQSRGFAHTKSARYRRFQCNSCHAWFRDTTKADKNKAEFVAL